VGVYQLNIIIAAGILRVRIPLQIRMNGSPAATTSPSQSVVRPEPSGHQVLDPAPDLAQCAQQDSGVHAQRPSSRSEVIARRSAYVNRFRPMSATARHPRLHCSSSRRPRVVLPYFGRRHRRGRSAPSPRITCHNCGSSSIECLRQNPASSPSRDRQPACPALPHRRYTAPRGSPAGGSPPPPTSSAA